MDIRIGVELTGDSSGYEIKLHAYAFRVGVETFGYHAEEMAHTHRRFKNVRSRLQPEPLHGLPHCLNDYGGGVMRIRCRGACRGVLLLAEGTFQLFRDPAPIVWRIQGKQIGESSPARVLHENALLFRCRRTGFGFDSLERADSGQVGVGLLFKTALADGVGAGYVEVAGKG
jgi:hypothetical protein